ncbi:hypothetical protein DYBT9623_00065 [Dyadobacter sp. CECT 9623]|uniref:VWFA domain-containing protein n=1 Tax=Dyadobacter linearis TaxID=2823330 RepID=A0ABM8UIU3_9BACT|nr:VWA domain-containing protein [Dyadobacter sp. CECT 9623]CAG5067345.1 hypothetical protein DYBT9623_00065 [Dyadobacter sp. CECT 9623]
MRLSALFTFMFSFSSYWAVAQHAAAFPSLNQYVEFLNKSANVVTDRFEMLRKYQSEVEAYQQKPGFSLRLPSSGPLEEYYYKKCLEGTGLQPAEKLKLNAGAEKVWQILNRLDETAKTLETHVRLNAYQNDNLKQSSALVSEMEGVFIEFRNEKTAFYKQIQQLYRKYQPYDPTDPFLSTEREMEQILASQQQLLDSLPYYLRKATKSAWPVERVQKSMLLDEKWLAAYGKAVTQLPYPASSAAGDFKRAIASMQDIKRRALDDHNFAAQQSAEHGNSVYISLLRQFNQDMLAMQISFVNYSKSGKRLLFYPAFSPVTALQPADPDITKSGKTPAFEDIPTPSFKLKKATAPATPATISTFNGYIDFINESLRQMHLLQLLTRNYQSSAEYYRDLATAAKRADLTYSHADFKVPLSDYQLLINSATAIPQPYRKIIATQAEVLLNILKEMDGLSIELVNYTVQKQYLKDQLKRSDEILDRYAVLFGIFDQKKEQLYEDIRRIHESFPNADPASSWYVSGNALLQTLDADKENLFAVRAFLEGKSDKLPETAQVENSAKQLIADEYKNMKGLQRYGRSNGLCPYTPYEDLAGNSLRFSEKVQKLKPAQNSYSNPYESFYYFYNGELVYLYNKFVELANAGLLKTVNQPDLFAFRRLTASKSIETPAAQAGAPKSVEPQQLQEQPAKKQTEVASEKTVQTFRDTVYVERVRVDTVYLDRNTQQNVERSLEGFAANNMILLLDVSSSMNSPFKMPLLKRSIKSLLTLLRPEDQITIVLYSGKARVVLKPTSGSKASEIARMIDLLQSDGDTDGNEGIKLAYKTANKSYIRGGNNRIVLATDGEFPVSDEVLEMIKQNASQDLYLTVFTFGRNANTGQKLKKLSQLGQGTYAHVTEGSADLQLIIEAQARKKAAR